MAGVSSRVTNPSSLSLTQTSYLPSTDSIVGDTTPLPPPAATEEEDEAQFDNDPWVEPPIRVDYGTNVEIGENVFINFNATILDTCKVSIGARTLLASNVSLFSGTHPLDPEVRNGTRGPETGKEIVIEEDCWLGGNVTVLPGVRIGRGSTVGAASVVTKVCLERKRGDRIVLAIRADTHQDVAPYTVVAGNPARKIRNVPRGTKEEVTSGALAALEKDQADGKA